MLHEVAMSETCGLVEFYAAIIGQTHCAVYVSERVMDILTVSIRREWISGGAELRSLFEHYSV